MYQMKKESHDNQKRHRHPPVDNVDIQNPYQDEVDEDDDKSSIIVEPPPPPTNFIHENDIVDHYSANRGEEKNSFNQQKGKGEDVDDSKHNNKCDTNTKSDTDSSLFRTGGMSRLNLLRRRLTKQSGEHKDYSDDIDYRHQIGMGLKERNDGKHIETKKTLTKSFYLDKHAINQNKHNTIMMDSSQSSKSSKEIHYAQRCDPINEYSDQLKNIRKSPMQEQYQKNYPHSNDDLKKINQNRRHLYQSPMRRVAEGIPEVHFIGEIHKGYGFCKSYATSSSSISCKWKIDYGSSFSNLSGETMSQTQYSMLNQEDLGHYTTSCIWNHPIDVHFTTASMKGWPRIIVQLWELDKYGRTLLVGFGFAHFPCSKGMKHVTVPCWKPRGLSLGDEIRSFFLGSSTHLTNDSIVFDDAWQNRHQMLTTHIGHVSIHISTIMRYFHIEE